jgi:hypothetical protein
VTPSTPKRKPQPTDPFGETTVRYARAPQAVPCLIDDEEVTLPVDGREMAATAHASLFIDTAVFQRPRPRKDRPRLASH